MTMSFKAFRALRPPVLLGLVLGVLPTLAGADTLSGNCPVDRPCFVVAHQTCHQVLFEYDGIKGWDFYNVRYPTAGGETQVKREQGTYLFDHAKPASTYTLKVQGCHSRIGHDACSPWSEASVTTAGDYGPDTCQSDLVWRMATPSDHVCVDPQFRQTTADENAAAAANRQPGGGASGPATCKPGFVWRLATPSDLTCVLPARRDRQVAENNAAARRRLCP